MSDDTAEATCWLHLAPHFDKRGNLKELRVDRMTKTPASGEPGGVSIKVRLRLPAALFRPLAPEVTIDVPAEQTHIVPEVDATPVLVPDTGEEAADGA